jgi:hypothetical protein
MSEALQDRIVDSIPWAEVGGPTARQANAATWAAALIDDLVEDVGQNQGVELNRQLLEPYREIRQVGPSVSLPWCAIFAVAAWAAAMDIERKTIDPEVWARDPMVWHRHPLGGWLGAVWEIEAAAKARRLWMPASELKRGAPLGRITGALLCRDRSGSGSDRATRAAAGGTYPGHVDLCVCWTDGRILALGGNLSDRVRVVERDVSDSHVRGAALFPV